MVKGGTGARANPGQIRNKDKRAVVMSKLRVIKKKERRVRRETNQRANLEAASGGEALPRKLPRTQESTRIDDPTFVDQGDLEVKSASVIC